MKPVGIDPIKIDGIILRKSVEVPEGIQVLYDERSGRLLWLGEIGTNPDPDRHIRATAVTLSHKDYELAFRTHLNEKARAERRRFRF